MTKMTVSERNAQAKKYVCEKLVGARIKDIANFTSLKDDVSLNKLLQDLICVQAAGFRGVVITAIVGMYIDSKYNPLSSFYSCKPRAIFENGIWYALTENKIPCGKSDPLNVAKNINELNESWAKGRRPQKSALAAVSFLRRLTSEKNKKRKDDLINYFFLHLVNYARTIESIEIATTTDLTASNQSIATKLVEFILAYPESGTMPQMLIGLLLTELFDTTNLTVYGTDESVFGTNTTSKKPADIWVSKNSVPINLYEITVKKVDFKRLADCLDALRGLNLLDKSLTFICRMPQDISELALADNNTVDYKGKIIDFVDIASFVRISTSLISNEKLIVIVDKLRHAMQDVNRPVKTKEGWNKIFN